MVGTSGTFGGGWCEGGRVRSGVEKNRVRGAVRMESEVKVEKKGANIKDETLWLSCES